MRFFGWRDEEQGRSGGGNVPKTIEVLQNIYLQLNLKFKNPLKWSKND